MVPEEQEQSLFPPDELLEFIRAGNKFLVAGHKEPDGDCVGSQLALVSALKRLGKQAIACSSGPFKKTEIKKYENQFLSSISEEDKRGARVIITDCGSLNRIGDMADQLEGLPLAIVDHHEAISAANNGNQGPVYRMPRAASTTILVLYLLDALGLEPTQEEAGFLFFGICTDTGFFRHIDASGAGVFDIVARLVRFGVNPAKVFREISGGKSLESRVFMGRILARAESHFGGKMIVSTEEYEEITRFGLESRDSDAVYREFQSVTGVEAIALIRQEKPDSCSVGLRSRDNIDVSKIAKSFGGGGHKNASAISSIDGTITEIKPLILEAFKNEFPPHA